MTNLSGFEWASLLVLFFACAIPVLSMLLVAVGTGLLGWKLVARMETQSRDLMKCIMALSSSPQAHSLAGMMETTDAARDRLEAESAQVKATGEAPRILRRAQ
jgi:hypothetical protein